MAKEIPEPSRDWLSRIIAIVALVLFLGEFAFYLVDRQIGLREDLYVELIPAPDNDSVEIIYRADSEAIVLGFPFQGRIVNTGRNTVTISAWRIVGGIASSDPPCSASFLGATSLVGATETVNAMEHESTQLTCPVVLPPGAGLHFDTWLRIEPGGETDREALLELAEHTPSGVTTRREVTNSLIRSGDLCANTLTDALSANSLERWLAVRFSVHTAAGACFGYSFRWIPPLEVDDARPIKGRACRELNP